MFKTLQELETERTHKFLSAQEISEKGPKSDPPRPMSKDECDIFDRLKGEIEKYDEQIAELQAHERRAQTIKDMREKYERPAGPSFTPAVPQGTKPEPVATVPATCRRYGPLKVFKPRAGETMYDAERRAYRCGMWARATLFRDDSAYQWCLTNGMALDVRNAMGTTSNTDGGALVPEEFSQQIIDLREEYGVFRRNCQVVPMGRDVMIIPRRLGGITIGPIGENPSSAISQSNPTFNQVQLTAKKCGGLTLYSSELAEDAAISIAEWIGQEFAFGFANFEDTAGFTGDGTSTYLGIRGLTNLLTTASGLAGAVAAASTHDTFAEIDNADLTKVMAALPQYARRNAKWYASSVAVDLIFHRLQAVAGGNTVQTLQGGLGDSYLGYPIVISQVLPTSTSTINGTAMLFFGDLAAAAALGDRRQVMIARSDQRYFDTDQLAVRGIERIDIQVHDVGTSSVGGPIVGLMGTT